jgi:hypothetical protein
MVGSTVFAGGAGGSVLGAGAVCAHTPAQNHTSAAMAPAQAAQRGMTMF